MKYTASNTVKEMYDYVHLTEIDTATVGFVNSLHTGTEHVLLWHSDLPGDLQLFSPNRVNSL